MSSENIDAGAGEKKGDKDKERWNKDNVDLSKG